MDKDFLVELYKFIVKATSNTYAGGAEHLKSVERRDHNEFEFSDGDFYYHDSYAGFIRSRGSEYVSYKGKVVWENGYGGGMVDNSSLSNEQLYLLAKECFDFLKVAMKQKDTPFQSFRGPKFLEQGDWSYSYTQTGDVENFIGHEEIRFKGEVVFWHDIVGGVVY